MVVDHPGEAAAAHEVVQTIQDSGGKASAIETDVSIADAVQSLFQVTVEAFGTVDILTNNAGICPVVEWLISRKKSGIRCIASISTRLSYARRRHRALCETAAMAVGLLV